MLSVYGAMGDPKGVERRGTMIERRWWRVLSAMAVAVVSLVASPTVPRASANGADPVQITVRDADGAPIAGAVVAVRGLSAAKRAGMTDKQGQVTLYRPDGEDLMISAPGFVTVLADVNATTAALTRTSATELATANTFGAQVRSLAADATSGVMYATTDNLPAVWRTTDHGGTWAPVPTTVDSPNGLPQEQASQIVTSGTDGEVAVLLPSGPWFSRDYGNTWASVSAQGPLGPTNNLVMSWARSAMASLLLVRGGASLSATPMPTSNSDPAPVLGTWDLQLDGVPVSGSSLVSVIGVQGNLVLAHAEPGVDVKLFELAMSDGPPEALLPYATVSGTAIPAGQVQSTDLLMVSTLGTPTVSAVVTYDAQTGPASGTLGAAYWNGTSWTANSTTTGEVFAAGCGENGTRPVGSIAPVVTGVTGFSVAGTVRSCFFVLNVSGASANWFGTSVNDAEVLVKSMSGANNNTGFVFDAAFDFSTNLVALSGDGQFGLRKSATMSATGPNAGRPFFGTAGGTSADQFVNVQAAPGTGFASGGVAVTGLTAPVVKDLAFDPNSATGQRYVVALSSTGGSRTLLTTDGGASFSTIGAGGSQSVAWWNGASGRQYIAAGYVNNARTEFLQVKVFQNSAGAGALQMGEELAATAALRDATVSPAAFRFPPAAANPTGTCFGLHDFVSVSGITCASGANPVGSVELSAITGVEGTDMVLVGASRTTGDTGQGGTYRGGGSAGTVALVTLDHSTATAQTSISAVTYFGASVSATGTANSATTRFGASVDATYDGGIEAIAYCPVGSAARVADKAFIAVSGRGIYTISDVTGTPTHGRTAVTSGTFADLKVDCDTGLLGAVRRSVPPVAGVDGLHISLDGDTFVRVAMPTGPSLPPISAPAAVALRADKNTGALQMAVAGDEGNVIAFEGSVTDFGVTVAQMQAGTAPTPPTPPVPPLAKFEPLNAASGADVQGRKMGAVADLELPKAADDVISPAATPVLGLMGAGRLLSKAADLVREASEPVVRLSATSLPVVLGSGAGTFAAVVTVSGDDGGGSGGESGGGGSSPTTPTDPSTPAGPSTPTGPTVIAPPVAGTPSTLVTPVTRRALTAPAGSAISRVNGQEVTVEQVRVPLGASPAQVRAVAADLVATLDAAAPTGATLPVQVVSTAKGASITGLASVAVPAQQVVVIDGGGGATMVAGVRADASPADVAADGVLELTSGGGVAALSYGFVPGESGEVVMMSDPRLLGTFTTSGDGAFAGQVTVPTDLPPGDHTLVIATASRAVSLGVRVVGAGGFTPVTPRRLIDTRATSPVAAGGVLTVNAVGATVPAEATAVTVNITATRTGGDGYVTVWPCDGDRPVTSTLNFTAGVDVANAATVGLGTGGTLCVSPSARADILVDLTGYVSPSGDGRFSAVTARRLLDTRSTGRNRALAGSVTEVPLTIVPAGATAVALNVTSVRATAAGFVTVYPCGTTRPVTSSLNFRHGDTVAGSVIARLDAVAGVCVYTSAATDILVDVAGWFGAGADAQLEVVAPQRVLDTRGDVALVPGVVTRVPVSQWAPAGSTVIVNLTAVSPLGDGYVTATNCGATATEVSNLNVRTGITRANQAVVAVSSVGEVCLMASTGTHIIVDLVGRLRS